MEWYDGNQFNIQNLSSENIKRISSYIGLRTNRLALNEDPHINKLNVGWGWQEILSILRRAFSTRFGYLKNDALMKYFRSNIKAVHTLIDGRMQPEEWIYKGESIMKLDFEQHNFGAPELDIVDPAYDLAATVFEFRLSEQEEAELLEQYKNQTGDNTISDRLILYKLLYGNAIKKNVHEKIYERRAGFNLCYLNLRFIQAWSSLVYAMNKFNAGIIKTKKLQPSNGMEIFLDLDGVLDSEVFGFPHTTLSGLTALALLLSQGCSVVPNTGRGIEHVKNYCYSYGFSSGIAEYGSVLFDNVSKKEIPLVSPDEYEQLNICRSVLDKMPGVFYDPNYHYSIRAYRYNSKFTSRLSFWETEDIIRKNKLDRLKLITRDADTYFVGKSTSKGNALKYIIDYQQKRFNYTAAIGDSDEDISMFQAADISFAPSNCSPGIYKLGKEKKVSVVSKPYQPGLLKIVENILSKSRHQDNNLLNAGENSTVHHLLFNLLKTADQSRLWRTLRLIFLIFSL